LADFQKKYSNIKFNVNPYGKSQEFHADEQRDGRQPDGQT
jgi:hypothetical protein